MPKYPLLMNIFSVMTYLFLSLESPRERCLLARSSLSESLERAAGLCLLSLEASLLLDPLLSDRVSLRELSACRFLSCLSRDRDRTTLLLSLSFERLRDLDRWCFFVPMSVRLYVGVLQRASRVNS